MGDSLRNRRNKLRKSYDNWRYSPEGIHYHFGGCYTLTNKQQALLFRSLAKLPKKIIEFTEKIFFMSEMPEGKGGRAIFIRDKKIVSIRRCNSL